MGGGSVEALEGCASLLGSLRLQACSRGRCGIAVCDMSLAMDVNASVIVSMIVCIMRMFRLAVAALR